MRISMKLLFCALTLVLMALPAAAQLGFAGPSLSYEGHTEYDGAVPGSELRVLFQFQLDEAWHVNSHTPLEEFLIPTELTLDALEGLSPSAVIYPEHKTLELAFSDAPLAVYEHNFSIGAVLKVAEDLAPGNYTLTGTLRYQACNDTQCAPPKNLDLSLNLVVFEAGAVQTPQQLEAFAKLNWENTTASTPTETPDEGETPEVVPGETAKDWKVLAAQFDVIGREYFVDTAAFVAFIEAAESGTAAEEKGLAGKSWWWVILIVIGGGFLLNLTPCVLPLIPINVAIIGAGAQAGSRARGFALGGIYGVGIAFVYGMLGLVVVLGLSTAFGAINSTLWFNVGIAVLFVVLALAMFDVIMIDFTKYQSKIGVRNNKGGSFFIAFVMGAVSALLAGACVAPVVIYTIIYAQDLYADGVTIALALPFLLGVGMALPWPFAGAGLSFLPKPGMWMKRVKQAFGVFILGFAIYYGYIAYGIFSNTYLVDPEAVAASVAESSETGWETSLEAGLQKALDEDKPVLLDFWATWCKNCLVMNKSVLKDPTVLEQLDGYIKIKYQAEDFAVPATREVLEHYEVLGLPTYVILQPKG